MVDECEVLKKQVYKLFDTFFSTASITKPETLQPQVSLTYLENEDQLHHRFMRRRLPMKVRYSSNLPAMSNQNETSPDHQAKVT